MLSERVLFVVGHTSRITAVLLWYCLRWFCFVTARCHEHTASPIFSGYHAPCTPESRVLELLYVRMIRETEAFGSF